MTGVAWTPLSGEGARPGTAPYSSGSLTGDGWVHTAGLVAIDADGASLCVGDVAGQVRAIFAQATAILATAGGTLDHVVSVQIFLRDYADYATMNEAYRASFSSDRAMPPRFCIRADLVRPEWLVEMAFVARIA